MAKRRLLFICTGNYYRSRFAEALFNHFAQRTRIPWGAFSRGLYPEWVEDGNDLSPHTRIAMLARGIQMKHTGLRRTPLSEVDLKAADHVIALKRSEHRPMMLERFPAYADKIAYWEVHDIDYASPEQALPEIESHVITLTQYLMEDPEGNFLLTSHSKV